MTKKTKIILIIVALAAFLCCVVLECLPEEYDLDSVKTILLNVSEIVFIIVFMNVVASLVKNGITGGKYKRGTFIREEAFKPVIDKIEKKGGMENVISMSLLTAKDYEIAGGPPKGEKYPFSRLLGTPDLPENIPHPTYGGEKIPILCRLDFAELNKNGYLPEFPTSGRLYIFADGGKLSYTKEFNENKTVDVFPKGEVFEIVYSEDDHTPENTETDIYVYGAENRIFKSWENCKAVDKIVTEHKNDAFSDYYFECLERTGTAPHIGGTPHFIQNDDLETLNGEYGTEHALLLTLGAAGNLYVGKTDALTFGDNSCLYFFIPKEDFEKRDFSRVKLIKQDY